MWEAASAAVKAWSGGRTAFASVDVKCTVPPYAVAGLPQESATETVGLSAAPAGTPVNTPVNDTVAAGPAAR